VVHIGSFPTQSRAPLDLKSRVALARLLSPGLTATITYYGIYIATPSRRHLHCNTLTEASPLQYPHCCTYLCILSLLQSLVLRLPLTSAGTSSRFCLVGSNPYSVRHTYCISSMVDLLISTIHAHQPSRRFLALFVTPVCGVADRKSLRRRHRFGACFLHANLTRQLERFFRDYSPHPSSVFLIIVALWPPVCPHPRPFAH